MTLQLGTTPSGLTSAHLHHPRIFFTGQPFLPPNQQRQSTEGTEPLNQLRNLRPLNLLRNLVITCET